MKKIFLFFLIALTVSFVGCGMTVTHENGSSPYEAEFFAMDTYMKITAYGSNAQTAVKLAEQKVNLLDAMLNAESSKSEINALNKNGSLKPSSDCLAILNKAVEYSKVTNDCFNPALHPVTELWGFTTKKYRVPNKSEIADKLALASPEKIILTKNSVKLGKKGMEVDLGGIAKGYTSSSIAEIFKNNGVKSAIINLGGNVRTVGTKPDGSQWNVAVENPDSDSGYLGILKTHDKAVITSGGYERNFEQDGKVYHHIIDPSTGYPAESGLKSVTIISRNDTLADAFSTALFVMGEEKAVEFWKNSSEDFDIILYNDKELIASDGIKDSFTSELDIKWIVK